MKRVNIRDAFVGEPDAGQEGIATERAARDEGAEALLLAVRGGEVTLVVPAGTDDARAAQEAECLRGVLRLENERVLTFEIHDAATGAFFEDEPAALYRRRQEGAGGDLSVIADSLDYMASAPVYARELMTPDPVTVRPDLPIQQAASLLTYHHISGLPVLDAAGTLLGVVSEADVIGKEGATVGEIMSRPAITAESDARIEEIAALMTRERIKRIPIVQQGRLVGIISRADIVRWAAR
jgi:CBS domain-containing protein